MLKKIFTVFVSTLFFLQFFSTSLFAEPVGSVKGTIMDAQTKERLPFANLIIVGTSMGAAADKEGNYTINNIPEGNYTLRATFVGYNQKEVKVEIRERRTLKLDFYLEPAAVQGQTVVVTAQAEGQLQAINNQLSSLSIKNVVSSAKIQELPDANAAESVSRLPGVSLIRTGGEGSQVVIRGLSPQFNQITIDGVELSSDLASSNNIVSTDANQADATGNLMGDRGMDLSMISSNNLGGIEVIKAITPDMDAAVIGGVVNFDMRKAVNTSEVENRNFKEPWFPLIQLITQGEYNQLKNTSSNYKFDATMERRFFDNSFGVFVQGSAESRNLSDNVLGATYSLTDKTHGDLALPDLTTLNLADAYRIRKRYNGTVVMDYKYKSGSIGLMNFFSNSDTKATYRSETAQITSPDEQLLYGINGTDTKLNVMSNLLSIKQDIPFFHVDLKLSHSYSQTQDPGDATFNFLQQHAGFSGISNNLIKLTPQKIATYIQPDDSIAYLYNMTNSSSLTKERTMTGSVDLQHNFAISDNLSVEFKFGGMYQYKTREYNYYQRSGSTVYDGGGAVVNKFINAYPGLISTSGGLSLANFVYNGYDYGNFLNGDFKLAYPLNADLMWQLVPIALTNNASNLSGGGYKLNDLASKLNNYTGNEKKSAVYGMFTVNIGDQITLLPGARYQNLTTTYTGYREVVTGGGIQGGPATVTKSHGYLLPMVHVIYKPFDWLQMRLAYTNTLNYPDYSVITPRYYVGTNFISYNNTNLKPVTSENYDLVVSVFTNDIGLFTIDAFKKKIKDLVFYAHTFESNLSAYPELPQGTKTLYDFTTYINSPFPVDDYGVETDWETHFWYLPYPFSGLVMSINYTHIFSKADYPKSMVNASYDEQGNLVKTVIDTSYSDRLLNQPDDILNMAVGYDYEGFSLRLSLLFQNNIFKHPDFWMQNRVNSDTYTRWDLSVKQKLPWYNVQVFFSLNNITGTNDKDINQRTSFLANEQRYGMTADLGLRITL